MQKFQKDGEKRSGLQRLVIAVLAEGWVGLLELLLIQRFLSKLLIALSQKL